MRLVVTTERGVYKLTALIVAAAVAVSILTAHVLIKLAIPTEFHDFRQFMHVTAYTVTFVTCLMVATPFSLMVAKSLLSAHQMQQRIISMALTDHLTGLPNRAAVLEKIEQAVAASVASGRAGSVLFVDLDHFKKVNDTFGHAGGDAALRHTGDIMRKTLGEGSIMGRFGGEEFVCFIDDADKAPAIAAKIIMALREGRVTYGDQSIAVKASIGLANTDGSHDTKHLLARADEALYIAKSSGRDCIVSYDEVALLRLVAASIEKPLRRRATDNIEHLSQQAA